MLPCPTENRRPWIILLALLTLFTYVHALQNDFTMDDRAVAMGSESETNNPMVSELRPISEYFSTHYWRGLNPTGVLYRPVTVLSFAVRHVVFGDSAFVAHLINVLLHVAATVLVYLLLCQLGLTKLGAWLPALFFGLHAIHSEAVIGIVGRAELLGFCFGAIGLLSLLHSRTSGSLKYIGWMLAAQCFFLAFCSKESALLWAAFVPAFLLAKRMIAEPGARLVPKLGFHVIGEAVAVLLPAFLFLLLRERMIAAQPDGTKLAVDAVVNPIYAVPDKTRVMTAAMVWGYGLLLTLFPFHLSADYGASVFPVVHSLTEPAALMSVISVTALAAILLGGLVMHRRNPLLFLASITFLGFSFVTSNVAVPIGTIFGERTFYTPSLGFVFAIAWLYRRLEPKLQSSNQFQTLATMLAGAWLGISTFTIIQRIPVWESNDSLFIHEAAAHPDSVRMQVCAAAAWEGRRNLELAAQHLERAVVLDPGYANAWNHLGMAYYKLGKWDRAYEALERGFGSRRHDRSIVLPQLFGNRALVLEKLGKPEEALTSLESSFRTSPPSFRKTREYCRLVERLAHALAEDPDASARIRRLARDAGVELVLPAPPAAGSGR